MNNKQIVDWLNSNNLIFGAKCSRLTQYLDINDNNEKILKAFDYNDNSFNTDHLDTFEYELDNSKCVTTFIIDDKNNKTLYKSTDPNKVFDWIVKQANKNKKFN